MTKAVASGMPKLRIEESAATRQAHIDRGVEVIVGVNKYKLDEEDPIDIRDIDNTAVRDSQIARIKTTRAKRDQNACDAALAELTRRAKEGGNLLEAAVAASRARATVGEISMAMEKEFGRHRAEVKTLAGVYGAAYEGDEGFAAIQKSVEDFATEEGRRPRMLVVKMGQDGHDRGAKVIATAFADIGFDVDGAQTRGSPERRRCRRYSCHLRRRDPATGLQVPLRCRRQSHFWTRHQHPECCPGYLGTHQKGAPITRALQLLLFKNTSAGGADQPSALGLRLCFQISIR